MKFDLSATRQKQMLDIKGPYSNQILGAVFNNIPDGVLIFDQIGNLIQINPEGLKMHNIDLLAKDEILNQPFPFYQLMDEERNQIPEIGHPVSRIIARQSFSNEHYIIKVTKDSPEIRITYSGFPQFDEEGKFIAGILFARSMSDNLFQKEFTQELYNYNDEIKQLEQHQQQLKEERELFQNIIDSMPVMVIMYDKGIELFSMNQTIQTITGWSYENIVDKNLMELVFPNPEYRQEISSFMKSLEPGFKDIVMRTRDGRDIETSWANVELPDGRQIGVGIDITERKLQEKELITARKKAEKESKVQYAFIQNISHEVRTPMNSILGFTELLQKEITRKKESEFLHAISYNGQQLLRLIDDIIDFSQLDNNQVSIQKEELNLYDLMNQIDLQMEGMKKAYKKRHLRLLMKHPANNLQITLKTDRFRLQQVLQNLLGNAIKYTEEGGIEIGYEVREEKNDVLFYIKDTGIGIDVADSNRVFKRFNRLHDTNSQEVRGTGLGLAICKHLVNLLGGEIWFKPNKGDGTIFYFSHPYKALNKVETGVTDTCVSAEQSIADEHLPDLSDKVILIVEDDSFSYMMMYHMLEESKAIILHADTGSKAIEIFDKYKVDLVFLDIRLPKMDGYKVIRYMHNSNPEIPVVAQTANALPEDRRKINEAGFDYHITKPISLEAVINVLNKFL